MIRPIVVAAIVVLLWPGGAHPEFGPCGADTSRVTTALERLRDSVDPCGDSGEIVALLDTFERCRRAPYEICTSTEAARNLFDRSTGPGSAPRPRTITWNPELRSELEPGCDGDPTRPVLRDPTASLLHEIVHAVHDCETHMPRG